MVAVGMFCLAFVPGCGGGGAAPVVPPLPPVPDDAAAPEVADASAPSASSSAAPVRQRKPFEIHNSCTEVVTIVFGDDAKAPGAAKRTLAAYGTADGPRDNDGNQTVWLVDANGEPLVKVRVTRGMKHVEVGRSCRTLDAS